MNTIEEIWNQYYANLLVFIQKRVNDKVAAEDILQDVFIRVYSEAFRVLKPGGRIAVTDIVLTAALPEELQNDLFLYTGCMAGASSLPDIDAYLAHAGFKDIRVSPKDESCKFIREWVPGSKIADYVVSATIEAIKPKAHQRPSADLVFSPHIRRVREARKSTG
jgi:SAM-dependent methyltransferase